MKPIKHRPRIDRSEELTPEGSAWVFRVRCGCGLTGQALFRKCEAKEERAAHLAEVTPPESEQCRDPKRHGCRPHDRCPVCADQLPLPGFEGLEATV